MPPVSFPPGAASGQVCTESSAIRRFMTAPTAARPEASWLHRETGPGASWADPDVEEVLGRRPEVLLVGLVTPEEIGRGSAARDGVHDHVCEEHDARREPSVRGIEARVVEPHAVPVLEAEEARDRHLVALEEPQARPSRAGQRERRVAEEA